MAGGRRVDAVSVLDVEDPGWRRFVAAHPEATCFHQPEWARLLADCYRYHTFVVVQRDAEDRIVGGLPLIEVRRPFGPRRWVCLPFSDECGPLLAPGASPADLVRRVDVLRRKHGMADLEIRADVPLGDMPAQLVGVTHTLALRGEGGSSALPRRARSSVRRNIATSQRLGVQVRIADTVRDLVETYYGLHLMTRRRQGVPAQPRRYFRMLWERMVDAHHGFLVLASHEGTVLAGAVYLVGGETVTYKYGASDARAWSMRPNHAVMAHAIGWAVEHGYAAFDFGRTDLDNTGLMRFKESWGATARPLRYGGVSGRRYQPPARTTAAVAPIIRRMPLVVCRGLGEVLYRYVA
jgi:lipid II:glycine glycyltransferase (peptidoglycan interpeptide bridge formation enzyme)